MTKVPNNLKAIMILSVVSYFEFSASDFERRRGSSL